MGHLGREKKKGERKEEKEERRRKKKEEKKEKREEERKKKNKHLRSMRPRWPRPRRAEAPRSAERASLFFLLHDLRQGIFSDQGAFTSPRVANSTSSHHHGCESHIHPPTQKNKRSSGGSLQTPDLIFFCVGGGWLRPCAGVVLLRFFCPTHLKPKP